MEVLLLVPVLLFSFVVHEFAHAWVALREGDPTAHELGRVTLDPIPHIDLFGTLLIPAMLIATKAGFLIGWARPVPVVPSNFRHGRRSHVKVAVAGVTANFLLAVALTIAVIGLVHLQRAMPGGAETIGLLRQMAVAGISLNFLLVMFNLLPLPPLDGWTVLQNLLPLRAARSVARLQNVAAVVFLLMFITGSFGFVLKPASMLEQLSLNLITWST